MGSIIELSRSSEDQNQSTFIDLPASKSISNRLLIMQALSGGKIEIEGLSEANDTVILAKALTAVDMYMADAGTSLRFGLAWAALQKGKRRISGTARLQQRPIAPLAKALTNMGARIRFLEKEGFAPLDISGSNLRGGEISVDGRMSSQFLSALMLIAPYCKGGCRFALEANQVSKPYILLTAQLMREAGAEIDIDENRIEIAEKPYQSVRFTVEADWSAAAFYYSFVALKPKSSSILRGLKLASHQGDRACAALFQQLGVETKTRTDGIEIRHVGNPAHELAIDFTAMPDLAQAAAVTAAGLGIKLDMKGLSTLRHKETDRIAALQSELAKFGVATSVKGDVLAIGAGFNPKASPLIETFEDHRMAMSFAALMGVCETVRIANPGVVAKSFPNFWLEFTKLGVSTKTYT